MGKIYLKGIKIYAFHGCLKEENIIGGNYKINLMVKTNMEKPAKSDDLIDAIDYSSLYKLISTKEEAEHMSNKLLAGGYGWGHAKKDLVQKIEDYFHPQREKFNHFLNNPNEVEEVLQQGAMKAKKVANAT